MRRCERQLGNRGKAENGARNLGGITSPGNSPYAITVGALNTWNTVSRSDDSVTTYSSRGPTRYDLAVKPDLVAPGNKFVSLEASGSYLVRTYPTTHVAGRWWRSTPAVRSLVFSAARRCGSRRS